MSNGKRARAGWRPEEESLLWAEIAQSADQGETLKAAFDRIADKTGRKPNSVRNYYYTNVKEKAESQGIAPRGRMLPFVPFADDEVKELMWEILAQRAQGRSVRACVQNMANGDRTLMLRYQNKYRSMLKSHPEWVRRLVMEMRVAGVPTVDPYAHQQMLRAVPQQPARDAQSDPAADDPEVLYSALLRDLRAIGDESVLELMRGLRALAQTAAHRGDSRKWMEECDRLNVRCDLLRLELAKRDEEILSLRQDGDSSAWSARKLVDLNRNFLGLSRSERELALAEYADELSIAVSALENASSVGLEP